MEEAQFNTDRGALPLEHWNQWRQSTAFGELSDSRVKGYDMTPHTIKRQWACHLSLY